MAGGRKGSHKGKSHQKKTSSESNEETTCAAQDATLFLDAPSNPAKRSRIEEADEFNHEETLKIFESLMQKCESRQSDMFAKISLANQFVVNFLPLLVDFIKSQKGVIQMKKQIEKQETEIKTLKEELLKDQIPKSLMQKVKSTNEQLKAQEKEIKTVKKELFKCKKSTREQIELQETETEALKEELAEEFLNCQLSKSTEKQLELQDAEIKTLKHELLNCQITNSTKSVIVKNLEPELESDRESPNQLRATFNKVLNDMGIQKETTVCDIFRIKSKSPPPTTPQIAVHEPVKITFLNKIQKSNFLKNLKNLKTYKNLKVSIDCPSLLLPEYKTASKKAYDIRTNKPGTQTILTIKNQKIVILTRNEVETTYKELKEETIQEQVEPTNS